MYTGREERVLDMTVFSFGCLETIYLLAHKISLETDMVATVQPNCFDDGDPWVSVRVVHPEQGEIYSQVLNRIEQVSKAKSTLGDILLEAYKAELKRAKQRNLAGGKP